MRNIVLLFFFVQVLWFPLDLYNVYAQSCPSVEKILINACGPGSQEGFNEYVLLNTGPSGLDINALEICFPNAGCYCNSGCGTQTFVSNVAYVNDLNAAAGCSPPLFVDAVSNNPLPPNALLLVFTGNPPTYTYNFSANCGQGPIYVLFANNTTNGTGRFVNSRNCSGSRYRTTYVNYGATCADTITYDRCNLINTDGESVIVNDDGSLTYGVTDGCTVLPEDNLIILDYVRDDDAILINWTMPEDLQIVDQWLSVYNGEFENEEISIEPSYRSYLVPNEWLPAVMRIRAITMDSDVLYSNHLALTATSTSEIVISKSPEPQILYCYSKTINIKIITVDGRLVFSGAYTDIEEANLSLKTTFRKFSNGIYVIRINDGFSDLIIKH